MVLGHILLCKNISNVRVILFEIFTKTFVRLALEFDNTQHSIAQTKFKIRRDKRNALLEIAMAEKTQKLLKHIVLLKIMC